MKKKHKTILKNVLGEISEIDIAKAIREAETKHKHVIELKDTKGRKLVINIHKTEDVHVMPHICENHHR